MKKWLFVLVMVLAFGLTACQTGLSSIEDYQELLEASGYTIESLEEADMNEVRAFYGDFVQILGASNESGSKASYGLVAEYENSKVAKEMYEEIEPLLDLYSMSDIEIKLVGKYLIMGDAAFMKAVKA